jgi:hypothetical protein
MRVFEPTPEYAFQLYEELEELCRDYDGWNSDMICDKISALYDFKKLKYVAYIFNIKQHKCRLSFCSCGCLPYTPKIKNNSKKSFVLGIVDYFETELYKKHDGSDVVGLK